MPRSARPEVGSGQQLLQDLWMPSHHSPPAQILISPSLLRPGQNPSLPTPQGRALVWPAGFGQAAHVSGPHGVIYEMIITHLTLT